MTLTTTGCGNCPFHSHHYNTWNEDIDVCELLQWRFFGNRTLNKKFDYYIDFYKNGKVKSKNKKTLDACPLLQEKLELSLTNC